MTLFSDRSRNLDFAFGALVSLPALSLLMTGGDGLVQLLALVYTAILVLSLFHPNAGLAFSLQALFVQMSIYSEPLRSNLIDIRILVPPVIASTALGSLWRNPQADGSPVRTSVLRFALPLVAILSFTSLAWSINPTGTLIRAASLLAVSTLCAAVVRTVDIVSLIRMFAMLGWLIIGACVLAWLLMPSTAIEQRRLRGLFENANGLAAFLVVLTPILLVQLRRLRWPAAAAIAVLGISTGSRAGCAALGVELLVLASASRGATARIACIAAGATASACVVIRALQTGLFLDAPIMLLRNTDSRSEQWAYGLSYFHAHPWTGVGMGSLPSGDIAGFMPEALATVGVVGTAILILPVLFLMILAARAQGMFMALVSGSMVDIFFEPWLFSGGSMICVLFWVLALHPATPAYTGLIRVRPIRLAAHSTARRSSPATNR